MARIGRNEPCPCGSGKKYKACCALTAAPAEPVEALATQKPLTTAILKAQERAAARKESLQTLGVLVFFTSRGGDAWLLDPSANDALQLAAGGDAQAVEVSEDGAVIEVTWSHQFAIENEVFSVTAYADGQVTALPAYPARRIGTRLSRAVSKFSAEQLASMHVDTPTPGPAS